MNITLQPFLTGLSYLAAGMAGIFLTIGLIIAVTSLLTRLFPDRKRNAKRK